MKTVRNLILILMAAAMMLVVQACDWAPWYILTSPPPPISAPPDPAPSPTADPSRPSPTPFPTIDITRQEFDTARANWQAASIEEYETEVFYNKVYSGLSGVWRLRVKGGEIVEYSRLKDGIPATPEPRVDSDKLKFLTIEAMFADIMRVLDDPNSAVVTISGVPYEAQYKVTFDDALGYPHTLGIYPIYITDNDSYTQVRSLKVLQTGPSLIRQDVVL